ncbi:hypothetical protein B0O99DRAFT_615971 [Bisporella sp. PMI_857]|nr:hypothetical protein B0O99DRAFT_615971 [Bisporella sp. PMI_857]
MFPTLVGSQHDSPVPNDPKSCQYYKALTGSPSLHTLISITDTWLALTSTPISSLGKHTRNHEPLMVFRTGYV